MCIKEETKMKINSSNNNNDNNNRNWLKTVGILVGGILGGMFLLVVIGALPVLLKNVPSLFTDFVPNFKVVLGYIYVGVLGFVAGRITKK